MKKIWTTIFILLLCACSNTPKSQAQSVMLSKEQQRLAQTNPCLALATIENGFEIRAYGEGSGLQQSDAYTEARINAESELLRKIDNLRKLPDTKKESKKGRKRRRKAKEQPQPKVENGSYLSELLRGTRPVLVKYHYSESGVMCRICLAIPIENIVLSAPGNISTKESKKRKR